MKLYQYVKWTKLTIYTILISLILSLMWLNFFSSFTIVHISGYSMEPTYKDGSWYLANKKYSQLQRGDVIIFKIKNEKYIKRIVALSGDRIPVCYDIDDDGQFYAYIVPMEHVWLNLSHEWISIPQDYIWVEGDAPNNMSLGSGHMGLVYVKNIIGVMNYTETPKTFWYSSVVNQRNTSPPVNFRHKHA